eukprot:gene11830-13966_t
MATQQETAASVRHFRNLIQLSAEYPDRWEDVIHFCDSIREGDDAMTFSAVRALEASIESIDPRECAAGLRFLEITVKNFYDPKGKSVRANPLQDILVDLFTDVWIARFHQVAASHPHNESIRNFLRGCIREWVQSLPSSMRSSPSKSAMLELCEHLEQPPPGLGDEATAAAQAEAEARERAFAADLERALELSRTESRENQASAFTEDQALHAALEISRLEEAERVGGAAQLEAVLQVSQLEAEAQLEKNRQATLRDELQHAYALLTKSQEEKKRELRNIDEEMAVAAGGQGDWELITELSKQHSLLEEEAKAAFWAKRKSGALGDEVGKCRELVLNTVTSLDSMKDLVARENASEAEVGLLEERALQALIAALTEHSQDTPTDSVGSAIYRELQNAGELHCDNAMIGGGLQSCPTAGVLKAQGWDAEAQEKFGERWDTPAEEKKLARKGSGAFGWLKSKLSDFSNKGKESPPSKPPAVGSASQGAVGNSA